MRVFFFSRAKHIFACHDLDGQKIVSASTDETMRVWSTVAGDLEQTLERHNATVSSAQFSPDGQKIVSASGDP